MTSLVTRRALIKGALAVAAAAASGPLDGTVKAAQRMKRACRSPPT